MIHYALFQANPLSEPPFTVQLGAENQVIDIIDCQNIPDAVEKIVQYGNAQAISLSPQFTLLYPIYMEAMHTDKEGVMHQIAWLIKDEADAKGWRFDRIGGLTNKNTNDFIIIQPRG